MPKTRKKRSKTKWYYMSDTTGKLKLVGLYPVKKLTGINKTRQKVIRQKLRRK